MQFPSPIIFIISKFLGFILLKFLTKGYNSEFIYDLELREGICELLLFVGALSSLLLSELL